MASDDRFPGFVPGRGYTQEDWDEVSDNPEITPEQAAASRPLAETMPELVAAMKRGRGNPRAPTKDLVTLRLDKDVLAVFRASGSGWQSRANEMLRKGLGLDDATPEGTEHFAVSKRALAVDRVRVHASAQSDRQPVDQPVMAPGD